MVGQLFVFLVLCPLSGADNEMRTASSASGGSVWQSVGARRRPGRDCAATRSTLRPL